MFFPETKLKILKELAKADRTPSELADKLEFTIPAVFKHLKELERDGFIKKSGLKPGKTRPFASYSLGDGFVLFMHALPHEVGERFLAVDENLKIHLRIWKIPQVEFQYYVEKFWWKLEEYLSSIDAVAVYGSVARGDARVDSDIDVLILANRNVKSLEKKFGALLIRQNKIGKMVLSQVFATEDFKGALRKESKFAQQVIKDRVILYDPKHVLRELK